MWCPQCNSHDTKVVDSRWVAAMSGIRRRRVCLSCSERFTTKEFIEVRYPRVVKRSGVGCLFDEAKIRVGINRSLEKRPITDEQLECLMGKILEKICHYADGEVTTKDIGYIVLSELREVDEVAYVRFASVYQSFANVDSFRELVRDLQAYRSEESESVVDE